MTNGPHHKQHPLKHLDLLAESEGYKEVCQFLPILLLSPVCSRGQRQAGSFNGTDVSLDRNVFKMAGDHQMAEKPRPGLRCVDKAATHELGEDSS